MLSSVKITSFPGLLDLLAPHSCRGCGCIGDIFCKRCKNNIIHAHHNTCPNCKATNTTGFCPNCPDLPPIFTIASRDTILGELIHDYKYYSIRSLSQTFAELLDATLPDLLRIESSTYPFTKVVLVPLPTASHHIRERGLDHIYTIARHLASKRHYEVQRLLLRQKNTVQVGADRATRLTQATSAYGINHNIAIDPSTLYVLMDDVWTTGASMRAAADLLRASGVQHIAISLLSYSTQG